jgi:hypothetical protein
VCKCKRRSDNVASSLFAVAREEIEARRCARAREEKITYHQVGASAREVQIT